MPGPAGRLRPDSRGMRSTLPRPLAAADLHGNGSPLVISREQLIVEAVLAAAASTGVIPIVTDEGPAVLRGWRGAPCVIVGADLAAMVASLGLPRRTAVHIVGTERDELVGWSVPLDASVIVIPDQSALLASVVDSRLDDGVGGARLVRVVGASGGLGASSLVAGLAHLAAGRSMSSVAVELDPCGGGLDLLFGAEDVPGWRWNDLRGASGRIESLAGHLPQVSGVDVLAMSRPEITLPRARPRRGAAEPRCEPPGLPSPGAVRSVVAALTRSHDLVVVDSGVGPVTIGDQWARTSTVMFVGASPRGIVAASARLATLAAGEASVVVRRGVGRTIDADVVATTLGCRLVGVVHDDRRLPMADAAGDPPARARGRFRRDVDRLLTEVLRDD